MERKVRCQAIVLLDDKLLVVKHVNHLTGMFYWWFPGGGVEGAETYEQCIVREVKEETNLDVMVVRLMFETHDPARAFHYERYVTFLCAIVGEELSAGTEAEHSNTHAITEAGWYPIWDEDQWETGFFEPHILSTLRMAQEELKYPSSHGTSPKLPRTC